VVLLEILVFSLLYRFTNWRGKQIAFLVGLIAAGLFLPLGILTWKGLDQFAIHIAFYVMIPYVLGIITSNWEHCASEKSQSDRGWFHWGPATMVVFFIVLAVVDSVIITLAERGMSADLLSRFLPQPRTVENAESRFPGTIYHDYHEKESLFNAYLLERQAQVARGWNVRKGFIESPVKGIPAQFKVEVTDREGVPIEQASVNGQFLRPSDKRLDVDFSMRGVGKGLYLVELTMPAAGHWNLILKIERDGENHEVRAKTRVEAPAE